MRNFRSTPANVAEKYFRGNSFISTYYPINFTVNDRYVFFTSLLGKLPGTTGFNVGERAMSMLYGPARNPLNQDKRSKEAPKIQQAIEFLGHAVELESARENQFLNYYLQGHPELQDIFNQIKDSNDPYQELLLKINIALKGYDNFKKEIDKEIQRIKNKREIQQIKRQMEAIKKNKILSSKKKDEALSELYKQYRDLNGGSDYFDKNNKAKTDGFGDTASTPYFNVDGKKMFESVFTGKQRNLGQIGEKIIVKYGAKLFKINKGKLQLNNRQLTVLLKLITQKAYEMLAVQFKGGVSRQAGESVAKRNKRIDQNLDELLKLDGEMDKYVNNILESDNLESYLDSIADQYQIPDYDTINDINKINNSIKIIKERLRKSYEEEKTHNKELLTDFDTWRKQNGASDRDLKEMVYMTSKISAQAFYTNEGMALEPLILSRFEGTVSGRSNITEDFSAGKLIVNIDYEEQLSGHQQHLIQKTEKQLNKMQKEAYGKMRKTETQADYEHNGKVLVELHEQQQKALNELQQQLNIDKEVFNQMFTHINVHGTVKGYGSIDATTSAFEGASFGKNIEEQIGIIDSMAEMGGITIGDKNWLIFALINCGNGMIGSGNKHALEDYLSAFVGLLMFNDATQMIQDVIDFTQNNYIMDYEGPQDIHLYTLNNKYVPASYILNQTYEHLRYAFGIIDSELGKNHGTNVTLKTYNPSQTSNFTQDELRFPPGARWQTEKANALAQTSLTMTFLAHFLDLLKSISEQLNFI